MLVLTLAGEGIYYFQLKKEQEGAEKGAPSFSSPTPTKAEERPLTAVAPEMAEPPAGLSLASPVEGKYLEEAILDEEYSQVLSFFLPKQTPVRAVFGGRVNRVLLNQQPFPNDLPFNEVWIEKEEGEFWASYIIVGEVLVQENQSIAEGEVLAKAGEGGLGFRSGANFSLRLRNKDNQVIKLSKKIFR